LADLLRASLKRNYHEFYELANKIVNWSRFLKIFVVCGGQKWWRRRVKINNFLFITASRVYKRRVKIGQLREDKYSVASRIPWFVLKHWQYFKSLMLWTENSSAEWLEKCFAQTAQNLEDLIYCLQLVQYLTGNFPI
jgi:hypothetical protein